LGLSDPRFVKFAPAQWEFTGLSLYCSLRMQLRQAQRLSCVLSLTNCALAAPLKYRHLLVPRSFIKKERIGPPLSKPQPKVYYINLEAIILQKFD